MLSVGADDENGTIHHTSMIVDTSDPSPGLFLPSSLHTDLLMAIPSRNLTYGDSFLL